MVIILGVPIFIIFTVCTVHERPLDMKKKIVKMVLRIMFIKCENGFDNNVYQKMRLNL